MTRAQTKTCRDAHARAGPSPDRQVAGNAPAGGLPSDSVAGRNFDFVMGIPHGNSQRISHREFPSAEKVADARSSL